MFQAAGASPVKFTYHQEVQVSRAMTPGTVLVTGTVGPGRPRFPSMGGFRPRHSPAGTGRSLGGGLQGWHLEFELVLRL